MSSCPRTERSSRLSRRFTDTRWRTYSGPPDIWALHPWVRDAANAAKAGQPAVVAWDLELQPEV